MDKHDRYRDLIQQALHDYAAIVRRSPTPGIETVEIFDQERDHYLIRDIGWFRHNRARHTPLHVRLVRDKIYIEEDMTEEGIATALLKAGVPKEDIVLAFQPPELRPLTDFAVA